MAILVKPALHLHHYMRHYQNMRDESFIRVFNPPHFSVPSSVDLRSSPEDFNLSRRALRRSPPTLEHCKYTAGEFVSWLESQGIRSPSELRPSHPRAWLAAVSERGVKALLRFWYSEGYFISPIDVQTPHLDQKQLPSLTTDELRRVLRACVNLRDRALVLLLADSGIRRAEVLALNWGDVDFSTGAVLVRRGKRGKARVTAIGATTRRALLAYRRSLSCFQSDTPLFATVFGKRMTRPGLRSIFPRLTSRCGILVTPHILRRTFARQSLRQGMDLITLQRLMGHSDPSMTSRYIRLVTEDLVAEHADHGLDVWLRS